MTSKRIVFIINALGVGGAEKVFRLEVEELQKRGHDVHMVLYFRRGELPLALPEARVHVIGARSVFDLAALLRLRRLLTSLRPLVAYSTLNESNLVARAAALARSRVTVVSREANMADVKPRLYRLGDSFLGWRSRYIVGVSRAVGDSVLAYAPHLRSRIRVLYNPVDIPSPFERVPAADGSIRLLTVGSLTPKKAQAILIRALALLPADFTLTIVGDGRERQALEALVRELDIDARVRFTGALKADAVAEAYKAHDIFVLPSSREGCPNVVLEALAYKLPVVAFAIPGMAEFVKPEWGMLAHTRDPRSLAGAIESLRSTDVRITLGKTGHEHVVRGHTRDAHMHQLEDMLRV